MFISLKKYFLMLKIFDKLLTLKQANELLSLKQTCELLTKKAKLRHFIFWFYDLCAKSVSKIVIFRAY